MKKLILLLLLIPIVSSGQTANQNCILGDCINGRGTIVSSDGSKFTGEFKDGLKDGPGFSSVVDVDEASMIKEAIYKYGKIFINEFEKGYVKDGISYSEKAVRYYLDSKKDLDPIEGIYRYNTPGDNQNYQFAILKYDDKYYGHIMYKQVPFNQDTGFEIGMVKIELSKTAIDGVFEFLWRHYPDKEDDFFVNRFLFYSVSKGILKSEERESAWWNGMTLLKLYPTFESKNTNNNRTGEWSGNGSGIIISKSGHIITNHHVIEDADEIEVEFILNDEVQKFNANVIQVDKTNDLAILKIDDIKFDGVGELPYNFKIRSSDVGTKVYAYGYPMALSLMGKEIKITDGIISAKSGFQGDITTYQITAPIQGGNSGGPLFDDKGNFLGINSSGINKEIADNVGYTIKSNYILNLVDVLPKSIDLPSNTKLESLPLTEQIKEISKYVVLIKVK